MTNKLFDSFVSDKLNNYESPVPDGLWEKIIAEEERKPKFIYWWNNRISIGVFAFLVLSGISYFGYKNLSFREKVKSNYQTSSNRKELVKGELATNSAAVNSIRNADSKIVKDAIENSQNLAKQNTKRGDEGLNNITELSKFSRYKYAKKALLKDVVIKEKNGIDLASSLDDKSDYKLNDLSDRNSIKNRFSVKKDKSFANRRQPNESFNFSDKFYNSNQPKVNGILIYSENNLTEINSLTEKKVLNLGKLFSGTDDCPTAKGTYRNDTYVEGYFSPDFAFKNVTSTKSGNDDYLSKKDSSETMQLGFTIGARFSKSITNNLLLKAGLQYSQMNEKFTLRTENDRRQTIVINSHTIIRPGQSDTTVSDTSVFVQIGYRVRTSMNYYRNLEIPLMLSYELPSEDSKWKFALNGGAILNLTSWYEGKTIDANYNLVNIGSKANNGFYKHQFGVSLYGGFSVLRNITPELDIFAEPYFRYGLYNVQSSVGFNQRFSIAGLQLGARLKINKNKHL
ncbi:MAG: hypothetical protein ACOVO1_12305 [Chitinophagaceae bacterium]